LLMSAATTPASRPPGRVRVRVSTASSAPTCGRDPSRPAEEGRLGDGVEETRHRPRQAACLPRRGRPRGRCGPSPLGISCRLTRVARDRCGWQALHEAGGGARPGAARRLERSPDPPPAAALRADVAPARLQNVLVAQPVAGTAPIPRLTCRLRRSSLPGGLAWVGPILPVRAMCPVQAASACPPLPPVSGSPVSAYDGRIGRPSRSSALLSRWPTWDAYPRQPSGPSHVA